MNGFLIISVRFLDDRYHGTTDNGEKAEWPPSPFRLFQALIAGNAGRGTIPETLRQALSWLESLDPPDVFAPQARSAGSILTYVPNNVSDTDPGSRTPKTIRATLLNGDRLVQYAWTLDAAIVHTNGHAQTLLNAARRINALGWGIDLSVGHGELLDQLPAETATRVRYRPDYYTSSRGIELRAPVRDSLVSLERAHADFLKRYETPGVTRLESASAVFLPQRYVTGASRPFVAFRLLDRNGDPVPLRHQLIKQLVGTIRALGNRPDVIATLGQEVIDRELKGHPAQGSPNRVSILPLPTLRSGPTDGRIRRVLLAQPYCSDGILCRALGRLFDAQKLTPLDDETRLPEIILEEAERGDKVLPYYVSVARTWASVTPVLLPGYDDRKNHRGDYQRRLARAEQLLLKALSQAGVDSPLQFELTRVPYWSGSLHAREYRPREKLANYPRWHVRITFHRPITGPLAIGAGRHCGFGLMAACGDD